MEERTREEVETSFKKMAEKLDRSLSDCQNKLALEDVIIEDNFSNRNGFSHSGFLDYSWSYRFIRDIKKQPIIERISLVITYREPIFLNQKPEITILRRSEKFVSGAPSFFLQEVKENIDSSSINQLSFYDLVKINLDKAVDALAK